MPAFTIVKPAKKPAKKLAKNYRYIMRNPGNFYKRNCIGYMGGYGK